MVAFVVDEFDEAVDVIVKPLSGVLDGLQGYSGTAMLGDGRLLLILDLEAMVHAERRGQRAPARAGGAEAWTSHN